MCQHLLNQNQFLQKTGLVLLFLCVVLPYHAYGQQFDMQREKVNQLDTAKLKGSDFRISREAYLENYGFNDTARALINLHFDKRRVAKVLKYSNLGFLAFIRVAGTEPTSPIDPEPETKYKPWVIPALVAAGGVAIYSFVRLDAWSLKRLLKTLYTYEKTGSLPDRLRTRLTSTHFEP